ncbi:MAG: response regulator [Pseudomonadota bacterium]
MTQQTLSSFVILLVEDEPADAYLMRMALKENRILTDFHHVVDGVEALEFLHRQGERYQDAPRPDLILLDLNMPRMNGREFLVEIKKHDSFSAIPVVVLTTSEVERDVVSSYRLGAAGYIVKPVDIEQLTAIVKKLEDYWCTLVRIPKQKAHGMPIQSR